MARLTRKFLSALNIEEDTQTVIIDAHTETVDALKAELDAAQADAKKYKADAEKLPSVQKELDDLKAQDDKSPYKQMYENEKKAKDDLQKSFDDYKADMTAKELTAKKEKAFRAILKEAGIIDKRIDSVVKVSADAINRIEFGENDAVKDKDNLVSNVKTEWADFVVTQEQQGAHNSTPPAGGSGDGGKGTSLAAQMVAQHRSNLYGKAKGE